MSSYQMALNWLMKQVPSYQKVGGTAFKGGLNNISALCDILDNPHKKLRTIHIGGTNGKGSTTHILSSILQEQGYKVGIYTSPHLVDFRERIKINGELISRAFITDFIESNKKFIQNIDASFFEICVALAFGYFNTNEVDFAIIEVGLGGRLDATNIVTPIVSVITNVSLDHTDFLGDTIEKIAFEKAGIIKKDTPVIIGEYCKKTLPIFKHIAESQQSSLHFPSAVKFDTDLKGNYQKKNINTAFKTIEVLKSLGFEINNDSIKKGILRAQKNTNFKGRWDIIQQKPLIIADSAHNVAGFNECIVQLKELMPKQLLFVLGFVQSKDWMAMVELIPEDATIFFTEFNNKRSWVLEKNRPFINQIKQQVFLFKNPIDALEKSKELASKEDIIFCGGSTFLISELIK